MWKTNIWNIIISASKKTQQGSSISTQCGLVWSVPRPTFRPLMELVFLGWRHFYVRKKSYHNHNANPSEQNQSVDAFRWLHWAHFNQTSMKDPFSIDSFMRRQNQKPSQKSPAASVNQAINSSKGKGCRPSSLDFVRVMHWLLDEERTRRSRQK